MYMIYSLFVLVACAYIWHFRWVIIDNNVLQRSFRTRGSGNNMVARLVDTCLKRSYVSVCVSMCVCSERAWCAPSHTARSAASSRHVTSPTSPSQLKTTSSFPPTVRSQVLCFCFYDNCFCFGQLGATADGVARHVGMVIHFICLLGILARDICGSSCVIVVHVTVYKQIILATVHSSDIIEAAIIFTAVLCNLEPLGELLCFSDIIITIEDGINVCRSVTSR